MANEPNSQEDSEKEILRENEQLVSYVQLLFKSIGLPVQEKPKYTTLMAVTVCVGIITLIALPLGAVWISSNSDCCFNDSLSNQLTFWAAMLAGFIALFGIVISGLFVVFAMRIDYGATLEAVKNTMKIVMEFININPQKILEEFFKTVKRFVKKANKFESLVSKAEGKVKNAEEKIDKCITEFCSKRSKWNEEAEEINQSMQKLKEKLEDTDNEISQIVDDVKASSEAAIERIDELVASVEQASDAALRRLQPPENRGTDEDSGN